MASTDFHYFSTLKGFSGGRRYKSNEEGKDAVTKWLKWTGGGSL